NAYGSLHCVWHGMWRSLWHPRSGTGMGLLDRFKKPKVDAPAATPLPAAPQPVSSLPKWMQRQLAERPNWLHDGVQATLFAAENADEYALVGEANYQE